MDNRRSRRGKSSVGRLDRAAFGITLLVSAWIVFRRFGVDWPPVVMAIAGLALLLSAMPRPSQETIEAPDGTGATTPEPVDSRPVEPDSRGSLFQTLAGIVVLVSLVFQIHPLADFLVGQIPYRLVFADRHPASPLRSGDLLLVHMDARPPRPGEVAWIGRRSRARVPELVTITALGPDSCECLVRTAGLGELERQSGVLPLGQQLPVTRIPAGAMRVAAHAGPAGSEPDWVALPVGWRRGVAVDVVLPPGRSLNGR